MRVLVGLLIVLSACQELPKVEENINWQVFMAENDLVWETFPLRWENAPFNGNGLVGSLLHASPDSSQLVLQLCRSDVGKLDFPGKFRVNNRIQLGSLRLKTKGKILLNESSARMNLWDGEITANIKTTKGSFKLRTFVALEEPLLVLEVSDVKGEEVGNEWQIYTENEGEQTEENNLKIYQVNDQRFHERSEVESGGYVVAWEEKSEKHTNILRVSINSSPSTHQVWNKTDRGKLSAKEDALLTFSNTNSKNNKKLFEAQRNWWHNFYQKSFVSFKNKELESYYWIQLYKMAASSRKGLPLIDNHGVWSVEPVYGFATWDLNIQIIYRLHLASNHFDLGEPLTRFLEDNFNRKTMHIDSLGEMRAGLRQQTFLRYRYFDTKYWEHDAKSPCDGPAKFLWGCHNYWLQFQYSQDSTMLPQLRDMLEGGINAMKAGMVQLEDSKWHIPYGHSWEVWRGKNPNAHIAVLNWALSAISELETKDDKKAQWQNFQKDLVDYQTSEKGYLLGENQPVKPHRHWSHLLHLFPLRTTAFDKEHQAIYKKSVDEWASISTGLGSSISKAGYSPCGAICLYAQMQDTTHINELMDVFLHQSSSRGPNVWANTMYREYGPVIETPLFFAASMHELFLQSDKDLVVSS